MVAGSHRGAFIVLEGGDGAGKTVQAKALCAALKRGGYRVCLTAEPSRNTVGRLIRRSLLQRWKAAPEVEALLFAADRFQHLESEVRPALAAGRVVVCDRYVYASLAYQGAQGVDLDWIRGLNRFAERPNLALYLDVPAETGLGRIRGRKRTVLERLELQRRVREEYLKLAQAGELTLVDASQPLEKVAEIVYGLVTRRLEELGIYPGHKRGRKT